MANPTWNSTSTQLWTLIRKLESASSFFFAHWDAVAIYKQHPDVILMDCTYLTNQFRIPLLNIYAVTDKKIQVRLAFFNGEKEADYLGP